MTDLLKDAETTTGSSDNCTSGARRVNLFSGHGVYGNYYKDDPNGTHLLVPVDERPKRKGPEWPAPHQKDVVEAVEEFRAQIIGVAGRRRFERDNDKIEEVEDE